MHWTCVGDQRYTTKYKYIFIANRSDTEINNVSGGCCTRMRWRCVVPQRPKLLVWKKVFFPTGRCNSTCQQRIYKQCVAGPLYKNTQKRNISIPINWTQCVSNTLICNALQHNPAATGVNFIFLNVSPASDTNVLHTNAAKMRCKPPFLPDVSAHNIQ